MSAHQIIRGANINKRQVVATYHGYEREMCPHVIGVKRGKPATRARGGRPSKPATTTKSMRSSISSEVVARAAFSRRARRRTGDA